MKPGRRAALAALLSTAVLMTVRHRIYADRPATRPCAEDPACAAWARGEPDPGTALRSPTFAPELWSRRDDFMGWPRLGAWMICLAAMVLLGGPRRWGWGGKMTAAAALLLTAAAIGGSLGAIGLGPRLFGREEIVRGVRATVLVALWEEFCFRGLLYRGLREGLTAPSAALLSSAAFMLMHWQAQPVESWPGIFLYGVVACAAAEEGASLAWLVFVHWAVDSFYFFGAGEYGWTFGFDASAALLLAAAAWWWLTQVSAEARRKAAARLGIPAGSESAKRP